MQSCFVFIYYPLHDKLHRPPSPPPPTPQWRGQPHTLPRYLILMINTYMYVCICIICMYSTYIFYILTTYNSIYYKFLLPKRCLYTTHSPRLKIDRHYLCTTYILPHNTYVPLVWMHQLLCIPHTACATPFAPQPTGKGPRTWTKPYGFV